MSKQQTAMYFEGSYVNDERNGAFVEKDRNGKVIARGTYDMGIRNQEDNL